MQNLGFTFILFALLSCNIDQGLIDKTEEPPEAPTPEISLEIITDTPASVPFGCPASESFQIKSVGTDLLTVEGISLLISATANPEVYGGLPTVPFDMEPETEITISVGFDSISESDVETLIQVQSNDPDLPVAEANSVLIPEAGDIVTDSFISTLGKDIDLLLVIDNSCSMVTEQAQLADNAEHIIDGLNANSADYHIGVITTDDSTFAGNMITKADSDPIGELESQMAVGVNGSTSEKGIYMAIGTTSTGGDGAPGSSFLRDNASLAVVFVSDEDDSSSGDLSSWSSHFWSIKPSPSDVVVWSIVGIDSQCYTASIGHDYIDLAQTLGGGSTSICDLDWQPTFEDLAAIAGTQSTFYLSDVPFVDSISVTVNGIDSTDWVYSTGSNAVVFNPGFVPVAGSLIDITYGISDC